MKRNKKEFKKKLIKDQIDMQERISSQAEVNVCTCGNCGLIIFRDMTIDQSESGVTCPHCLMEGDVSDHPDLWWEGCSEDV